MTATYGEHPGPLPDNRPSALDRLVAVGKARPVVPCSDCAWTFHVLGDLVDHQRKRLDHLEREAAAEAQRARELQKRLDVLLSIRETA